ncbi:hypothetical protein DFH09DRAFT_1427946 [Mycena vulgaris]|nr:hypothetical protein DFH09DRAFT_1427946 [Mycena vulgaris]
MSASNKMRALGLYNNGTSIPTIILNTRAFLPLSLFAVRNIHGRTIINREYGEINYCPSCNPHPRPSAIRLIRLGAWNAVDEEEQRGNHMMRQLGLDHRVHDSHERIRRVILVNNLDVDGPVLDVPVVDAVIHPSVRPYPVDEKIHMSYYRRLATGPPYGYSCSMRREVKESGCLWSLQCGLASYESIAVGGPQFSEVLIARRIFCAGMSENGENGLVGRVPELVYSTTIHIALRSSSNGKYEGVIQHINRNQVVTQATCCRKAANIPQNVI